MTSRSLRLASLAPVLLVLVASSGCRMKEKGEPDPESTPAPAASTAARTTPPPAVSMPALPPEPPPIPPPPDVAAAPADAAKTPSGLASKVIQPGTGKVHPGPSDTVKVHYTGWTTDGKMFDSSVPKNEPISFPLDRVIKGWGEGVQLMVVGEKRRLWIPSALAYGEHPRPGAPAGDLVFDIELLDVKAAPKPIPPWPVPTDVKAAPANAKKTASGLAYKVLKQGPGKESPKPSDTVTVHYTGWTTDGKEFDSSLKRGEPTSFPVGGVIKGWTEGLQLMKVGDRMRFWIPGKLAYGEGPPRPNGPPMGTLVFDVELLSIGPQTR